MRRAVAREGRRTVRELHHERARQLAREHRPHDVREALRADDKVHERREREHRHEHRHTRDKYRLDTEAAHEAAEHERLEEAVRKSVHAEDVPHVARRQAEASYFHRHGEEQRLQGIGCGVQRREADVVQKGYEDV